MSRPGTKDRPLRVAVIGSGPAGFYTVQHLLQKDELEVEIDMYDRLPTPFGLVRYGVAPDHQKIKKVTAVYHKLAMRPEFRFFGNVDYGRDISLTELSRHYHQIVFATGAQTDRRLGITGEDLDGSHPATDFVAWYNGHPEFSNLEFDLSCERAAVVGIGNVAVDVARILCRTVDELKKTDIADYALEALETSRIREVYLLGRRGPAQAKFTNPEVKELGELADTETTTLAEEVELDELSRKALESSGDKATRRKVEILQSLVGRRQPEMSRKLRLRFLVSPVEILGDERNKVKAVRVVRNRLVESDWGDLRPEATNQTELLESGLIFRSVGYRGVPLADLPFDDKRGVLPNEKGRIVDPSIPAALHGLYASGWIKRGPSGVIGTNKPDAAETVDCMLEDLRADRFLSDDDPASGKSRNAVEQYLRRRDVPYIGYPDWLKLDAIEIEKGKPLGRPRVKFTRREDFLAALERAGTT